MLAARFVPIVHITRWLVLGIVVMLCLGCPPPNICVKVPDTRAGGLVMEVAEGSNCDQPAVVTRLIVRRVSDDKVFWAIGSTEGVPVNAIRYGEPPPGMDQGMAALPLTPGDHLIITVNGRGSSGGFDLTIAP